jgi:uncharacterized membrane protein YccC
MTVPLYGLLLFFFVCMIALWFSLLRKRYMLSLVFFTLSTSFMILPLSHKYGFSLKVILGSTGAVLAVVLIGALNYWIQSRVVGWSMPFWNRIFKSAYKKGD